MKKTKLSRNIKFLIALFISVKISSFLTRILENTDLNVWISRVIGCMLCVALGLMFDRLWIERSPIEN